MSDLDSAVVAGMLKAKEIGVKMLASDCEAILQSAIASMQDEAKPVSPQYYMHVDSDNDWFEAPDDMCIIEDAFRTEEDLKVGAEYEVYASHTYKQKYRVTKVPDDIDDDTNVELISTERRFFTYPPDAAAEIARLTKELEEARKDAEAVAWYRETAGGIAICYVQNEPPQDTDGPWHPLYTSARKTWIPMGERRPLEEHGNKVLGLADDGYVFQCEYVVSDGEGAWCSITGETMTHWMPLPTAPRALKDGE